MKIQLNEIAAACGVSTMTVSRALDPARAYLVSEKRRKEILDCCEKYGYVPNYSASTLASGKSLTIGLLHPESRLIGRWPYWLYELFVGDYHRRRFGLVLRYIWLGLPLYPYGWLCAGGWHYRHLALEHQG